MGIRFVLSARARPLVVAASLAVVASSCGSQQPMPVASSPSPSPSAPESAGVSLAALEACDPAGLVACVQDDAVVSVPIAGTGLSLTWSSLWARGRQGHPDWDPAALGLGGWSVSALEAFAPQAGLLLDGVGSWRSASMVPAGGGETAIPTYDASLAYVFDASGRHVRTVDGRLGTTLLTVSYDASGRLASIKGSTSGDPVGLTVQRAADGTPTSLAGIDGPAVGLIVDPQGRLAAIRDPLGRYTSFRWSDGGLLASETDPMGGTIRFTYDPTGRLATRTDADGVVTRYAVTATATTSQVTETTALGRTTAYQASASGGSITRTSIAADGTTAAETDDAAGAMSVTYPDGTTLAITTAPSAVWGADALVATNSVRTRSDGVATRRQVAEALQPQAGHPYAVTGTVTTTIDGKAWTETFDPATRTRTLVDPAGRRSVQAYDDAGRLLTSTAPGQAPLAYTYDASGRAISSTVGAGSAARTTRYAYDASTGRVTATRPDGTATVATVDALGNVVSTSAADGSTTLASYDANGRLTGLQPPGALDFTLGSSAAGRATAFLPPSVGSDGAIESTTYNGDGQASAIAGPGQRSIAPAYDAAGRLAGWTTGQGQATLTYDKAGLLASATGPGGVTLAYGYTGSTLSSLSWSGQVTGSVATAIDGMGRTTGETVDGGAALTLAYDAAGALTGIGQASLTRDPATGLVTRETLGPVETDVAYDGADALVRSTTKVSGAVVLDRTYTRDALGRIATVTETASGGTTTTTAYSYDGGARLASVKVGGAAVETDAYDPAGDRTSVTTPSGATKATYDDRQRLTTWGATTYTWRPDGTLASVRTAAGTTAFSFDDLGGLAGATLPDGRKLTYLVDADGRRVGREVAGTLVAGYLYDPAGRVVALTDGSGAVTEQFGYDDQGHLALVRRGDATFVVVTDQLGSPRLVIDASTGQAADALAYDAWGRVTSESAPGFLPFGFAGGLRDPDTGLVHFGARDYDPVTGRWISSDPIRFAGGDANLYRYAGGDPANATDPSGMDTCPNYTFQDGELHSVQFLPCPQQVPPPPPPGPSQPPPGGAPGSPTPNGIGVCSSLETCSLPNDSGCYNGWCLKLPIGFLCHAEVCIPPNGPGCQQDGKCWGFWGDTHVLTGDRVQYDFQTAGEFIGARSPDGSVQVQVRQEPVLGGTTITFATAVAAGVAGDRVGVYARESSFLVVNGTAAPAPDLVERLPHGGSVERHGGTVTIGWPDGSRLTVVRVANTLNLSFAPSAAVSPTLRGLLGSADGNPADDLTGRDGTVLGTSDPAFSTKLYSQFGNSWRIQPGESLFDYGPGESTVTFTRLDIPSAAATVAMLPADKRAFAQGVCNAVGVRWQPLLDDCVLDVGETGDPAFAAAEAMLAEAGPAPTGTPGGAPAPSSSPSAPSASPGPTVSPTPAPSSVGPGPLTFGEDAAGTITAPAQHDDYSFHASAGDIVYGHAEGDCVTGLQWVLLGPNGALLGMGPGTCQEIGRVVLPTTGTYTVRVRSDGTATGAYRFVVTAVPPTKVDAVSPGQSVTGSIDRPGEWHGYTFAVSSGQKVTVTATGTCPGSLSWNLLRPDGSLLDFHPACGSMGPDAMAVPGTYTLRVLGTGAATGMYAFSITAAP